MRHLCVCVSPVAKHQVWILAIKGEKIGHPFSTVKLSCRVAVQYETVFCLDGKKKIWVTVLYLCGLVSLEGGLNIWGVNITVVGFSNLQTSV